MSRDTCPSWCSGHGDDEDSFHDSTLTHVPAILVEYEADGEQLSETTIATDVLLVSSRRFGSAETTVFIGEEDRTRQYLRLTLDSARRLSRALHQHLVSVAGSHSSDSHQPTTIDP